MDFQRFPFTAPATPQHLVEEMLHGRLIRDSYRWLEKSEDPEVIQWTHEQNDRTINYLQQHCPLPEGVAEEIASQLDRDVDSPPFFKAEREFFFRRRKGAKQDVLCTRIGTQEIILFDPLIMDTEGRVSINFVRPNKDASRLAVGYQKSGSEINDVRVIDSMSGEMLLPELTGIMTFLWARDERFCIISPRSKKLIESQTPLPVYRHRLGSDRADDILLIAPTDAQEYAYAYEPDEADICMLGLSHQLGNTVRIRALDSTETPREIYSDKAFYAMPTFWGDRIYWFTNHEASNYKLMLSTLDNPHFREARTLFAESDEVLSDMEVTKNFIIVSYRKGVETRLAAYTHDAEFVRDIELPELAHIRSTSYHKEFDRLLVTLTSFTAPSRVYALNLENLQWSLLWSDTPPIDLSDVEAHALQCTSKDGTSVPMFVVHKRGLVLDGSHPTYLSGYGGFAIGIAPRYAGLHSSFLKRGGVWVLAGIRGGDEFGEQWHRDGMGAKKQNCFDDFISCAEFLIREKYTSSQRLLIQGGSNGGLLIGACITQRPDLFGAALCEMPLLDMLRYSRFKIARYWIPEYGDPNDTDEFAILESYSPYHKIVPGLNLPLTLVIVGEYDTRTDPLHGKKFVAAAQNNPSQLNPVFLHVNYDSGHQGGQPIQKTIHDSYLRWQFIFSALGM